MTSTRASTLGDYCELVSDSVDPANVATQAYVGLEHIESGRLKLSGVGVSQDVRSAKHRFQPGDVLYGKLRPYLDKAVLVSTHGICSTELLVLRAKRGVNPVFVASILHTRSFLEFARSGVAGVQHPRTSWNHIRSFSLPDFDRAEQDVIARVSEVADFALTATIASYEATRDLLFVTMREVFTRGLRGEDQRLSELGPIPQSWSIESLAARHTISSGATPSRSRTDYWDGGTVPWVKTAEIDYSLIRDTEEKITIQALRETSAKLVPAGAVLMAMYGQGVTRGKVAMLGVDAACNQACASIVPKREGILPGYLYYYLAFRYEPIRMLAHGGQQQNLSLEIVKEIPVAFPVSTREQQEIVEVLTALDEGVALRRRKRAILEDLSKSVLHRLMTGEVRVSDLSLDALDGLEPATGAAS